MSPSLPRIAARMVALTTLFVVAACHLVAGDFEEAAADASGGTGAADGPGLLGSCTAGDVRCRGAELQVCDTEGDPPWRTTRTCPSAVTCDAQEGLCHVCDPGQHRCAGWQLETCNSLGSDFDVTAQCASSVYCDAAQGACLVCLPGEAHCDGADLSVCSSTGEGWDLIHCESPELCNARSQTCRPCVPGELQCSGATLQECSPEFAWEALTYCATPELCTKTVQRYPSSTTDGWTGQCEPPACEPGTFQCAAEDGRQLLGCPPSQEGWEVFDTCDTAMLCDAQAGVCQPGCGPGITPGTYRCEGAELQQCSLDGTRFETIKTCASAANCNATRQDCVACVPGEFQCSGATLQECSTNSTWETHEECASAPLCLAAEGRCAPPPCEEGTFSCAGNVLRRCASGSVWESIDYCVTDELCDADSGHCSPPGCPEGGLVDCAGNELRMCPSSLVAWEVLQACGDGSLCDAQNQRCIAECPTPPFQCQQGVPVECSVGGDGTLAWSPTSPPCLTSALCTASSYGAWCLSPVCDAGEYRCTDGDPQVLQVCAGGRDGWDDVAVCEGSICDAAGAQCDVCVANAFRCSGSLLQQCGPAGQAIEGRGLCRDADHCYAASDGSEGYCYLCDPDENQCWGTNQIQECADDRRALAPPTPCENGCQDNAGNTDYCAGCPIANEVQCVEEDRPGSTRACPEDRRDWGAPTTCTAGFGCVNDGTNDYCAGTCAPNEPTCVGNTGVHTCNATGEGFSATVYECANSTSLKRCVGGVLSSTEAVPCPVETPFCVGGACVECTGTTRECVSGTASRRECVNGKWQIENCAARTDGNTACYLGNCAPCNSASPASCLDNDTRRHCVAGAWESTDCTGETPVCSAVLANCAECNASSPATCPDSTTREYCATNTGTWVESSCDVRCLVVSDQGTCVACDPDTTTATCTTTGDGIRNCSSTGAITTTPCTGATPVCTSIDGVAQCVGCASGTCTGSTPYCLDGIRCVACQPGTVGCQQSPPAAGVCGTDGAWDYTECLGSTPLCNAGSCVGCIDDTNCSSPTPKCVNGTCMECGVGVSCPPTQSCVANSCECVDPLELCDDTCVNTSTDTDNCGACGNACVSIQQCSAGSCTCPAPTEDLCSGECVDTSTNAGHCGSCDNACVAPSGTCYAGDCVACVSDDDCAAVSGQTCTAGQCACSGADVVCGTSCTDLSSDEANCGACGQACTSLQQCVDDACVCIDTSLTVCSGICVDTEINASHCGACGEACPTTSPYCEAGVCVGCRTDDDCPVDAPYCSSSSCVQCLKTADCDPTELCADGICQPNSG